MNCKDDVYVRSHYDAVSLSMAGTPMPGEIALIFCLSTRGRLDARVGGGLTFEEAQASRAGRPSGTSNPRAGYR